jgi:hypothetical protein
MCELRASRMSVTPRNLSSPSGCGEHLGRGTARDASCFDEGDGPQVDAVDDLADVRMGNGFERGIDAPVAQEDVALEHPERGVDARLFECGS